MRPAEDSSDGYFAISLGAFRSFPSALTLIDRLSEDTTLEWSAVAPVALPDGLYHRVLAGLRPDSLSARALGAQLVNSLGDDAVGWFPRRIRVVVCTEPFSDSNSADEAARRALEQELLGEVRNPSRGDGEVRVCFGGYDQAGDADEVIRRLHRAGYSSVVVPVTTGD
ncbi:MAG: SPOR domain-containing protein [Longimicrobiales bacterium]|nr:SPOR domain-containing protein [Longimicrobiales bacterium]